MIRRALDYAIAHPIRAALIVIVALTLSTLVYRLAAGLPLIG